MTVRQLVVAFTLSLACLVAVAAEPPKASTAASVVLSQARLPPSAEVRSQLEARLQGRLKIDGMDADEKGVILLRIAGGTVMIGLIDAALPKGTVDVLCRQSWHWKAACEATAGHRAHILVTVLDTRLDRLDAELLLTDVIASLMDGNAIASYWDASLHPRDSFLRQTAQMGRQRPPVWLWVGFRFTNDVEKGVSMSTQGMESFGLREIETKDVQRNGRDVFSLVMGMASYLIQKGPVIQDGETVGDSPALNIRVRQGPSYWRDGLTVYRVLYPKS
jgi:hypothetical protein